MGVSRCSTDTDIGTEPKPSVFLQENLGLDRNGWRMSSETSAEIELLKQREIIASFGEFALRSNDLDEILTEACRLVGQALGTDLAKVMELQDGESMLLVKAGVGWKRGVIGQAKLEVEKTSSEGYALSTREPVFSNDIALETRFAYADCSCVRPWAA